MLKRTYPAGTPGTGMSLLLAASLLVLGGCSSSSDNDDAPLDDDTTVDDGSGADSDGGGSVGGDGGADGGTVVDGDTGGGSVGSGGVTLLGLVGAELGSDFEPPVATAGFLRFGNSFPVAEIDRQFRPNEDSCEITRSDDIDFEGLDLDFDDADIASVGAGEVIPVLNAGGTLTELVRQQAFGFIGYAPTEDLPDDTAFEGAYGSIPGESGGFPAVDRFDFPDAARLTDVSPDTSSGVTLDTTFTWDASSPGDHVEIDLTSFDFETLSFSGVVCTVVDDGSFTLPADIAVELGDDFASTGYSITRNAVDVVRVNGDAVLLVTTSSTAD